MERQLLIRDVYAREVLDPAGNLTIETEVLAGEDAVGRASAPSGIFSGRYDTAGPWEEDGTGGERYGRDQHSRELGVRDAAENINRRLADEIIGINVFCQDEIDRVLTRAQQEPYKSNMETNALLSISVAAARAACMALKLPLYRYLGGTFARQLPVPMFREYQLSLDTPTRLMMRSGNDRMANAKISGITPEELTLMGMCVD